MALLWQWGQHEEEEQQQKQTVAFEGCGQDVAAGDLFGDHQANSETIAVVFPVAAGVGADWSLMMMMLLLIMP
jgi:hypothetical protein